MSWFKVDDNFYDDEKTVMLSAGAVALWLRAGCWAAKHMSDGFVPVSIVGLLSAEAEAEAEELVSAGLWEADNGRYHFHNWTKYQPTKKETENRRAQLSAYGKRGAAKTNAKRWGTTAPAAPESVGLGRQNVSANVSAEADTLKSPPTRPDPYKNIKKENSKKEKIFEADTNATKPTSLLDEPYTADFEQFWAVYPRKTGKREAFKAWKQAGANRPSLPLLLAKATAYAASREVREGYALNASRWIRERRWEDSPEPASAAQQRPSNVGMSRIEANLEHNRQLVARYEAEEAAEKARQAQNGHADGAGVVPPLKLLNGRRVA